MCRRQRNAWNVYTCNSGPRFSICSITSISTLPTQWYTQVEAWVPLIFTVGRIGRIFLEQLWSRPRMARNS
jgi:hypothetical protein